MSGGSSLSIAELSAESSSAAFTLESKLAKPKRDSIMSLIIFSSEGTVAVARFEEALDDGALLHLAALAVAVGEVAQHALPLHRHHAKKRRSLR